MERGVKIPKPKMLRGDKIPKPKTLGDALLLAFIYQKRIDTLKSRFDVDTVGIIHTPTPEGIEKTYDTVSWRELRDKLFAVEWRMSFCEKVFQRAGSAVHVCKHADPDHANGLTRPFNGAMNKKIVKGGNRIDPLPYAYVSLAFSDKDNLDYTLDDYNIQFYIYDTDHQN